MSSNKRKEFSDIIDKLDGIHRSQKNIYEKAAKICDEVVSTYISKPLDGKQEERILDLLTKWFGNKRFLFLLMICKRTDSENPFLKSFKQKQFADLKKLLDRESLNGSTVAVGTSSVVKKVATFIDTILEKRTAKKGEKFRNEKSEDEKSANKTINPLVLWLRQGIDYDSELKTPLDRMIACYLYAVSCNPKPKWVNKVLSLIVQAIGVRGTIKKVEDFSSETLLQLGRIIYPAYENDEKINPELELTLMRQIFICEKIEQERNESFEEIEIQKKISSEYLDKNYDLREYLSNQEKKTYELERQIKEQQLQISRLEEECTILCSQIEESRRETLAAKDMLEYEKKKIESIYQSIYQGKLEELLNTVEFEFVRMRETLVWVADREKNSLERRMNTLEEKLRDMKGANNGKSRH